MRISNVEFRMTNFECRESSNKEGASSDHRIQLAQFPDSKYRHSTFGIRHSKFACVIRNSTFAMRHSKFACAVRNSKLVYFSKLTSGAFSAPGWAWK